MPYCFYCGKEIYLILPFLRTKDCYCEHCQGHVSVIPQGRVNEEELNRARRDFQRNYVFNMEPGMAYKEVVNRMLAQKAYQSSIIMFHPDERDKEPWSTLVAEVRHGKGVNMTDQIEKIIDKIHDEYQGLSRSEIEKIVRQAAEEIRRKDDKLLANSVAGTE